MEKDLKWIKKHYGEQMMHLCRKYLYQILETPGLLPSLLETHFAKNRQIAQDIIAQDKVEDFKNFIFSFIDVEEKIAVSDRSAVEIMKEAGYILYPECQTEEDIQSFRKYYKDNEVICTIYMGGRLNSCRVWFAVKENAEELRREDFTQPKRQDEYGTSVISIQFTKRDGQLSIKNRYNHTVNNPDNTFNSNLENIAPGLTEAFERDYGVESNLKRTQFELENYVQVNGVYYKYNYEINNIYYCDNNVVIDNFQVKQLPNSQMLVDYFVIDFANKTVKLYDKAINDCFPDAFLEIENLEFVNNTITIKTKDKQDIKIEIDDNRRIISYSNPNLIQCGYSFLSRNKTLTELDLPNLTQCGDSFLEYNQSLTKLDLPNLTQCGDSFLEYNQSLTELNLPNLTQCGDYFLYFNETLTELNLPNLTQCGDVFLFGNQSLTELNLPNLTQCGYSFLSRNKTLTKLDLPKLTQCGDRFLEYNQSLTKLDLPNLTQCGDRFLFDNQSLTKLDLPKLTQCGDSFLEYNQSLTKLDLPNLTQCGKFFLYFNETLTELNLPNLTQCGDVFLFGNQSLTELNVPNLIQCGDYFLRKNQTLTELNVPNLTQCGYYFLHDNQSLTKLNLPNLNAWGDGFLASNPLFNRAKKESSID